MLNYYWVSIKGKNSKNFLNTIFKRKINIAEIKYKDDSILIKVSYEDYKNIVKIGTSCTISIVKTAGSKRIKQLYQKYRISFIIFVISVFFIFFLSNLIFFIKIETNNSDVKKVISGELLQNSITLYSPRKSYKKLKSIALDIKNNHLDKIEWIEFEQKGVVLIVKVIPRIKEEKKEMEKYQDIVASKDGYIRRINSRNGQLLKSINDYVKKGEVIISGNIFRNDRIVAKTRATGNVYAEVWYVVKMSKLLNYKEAIFEGNGKVGISLFISNKELRLFYFPKKINSVKTINLFNSSFFSIKFKKEKVYTLKDKRYNTYSLKKILEQNAKESILNRLKKDEYIISEKPLKNYIKNDKMYIEVFFKCYEDIAKENELQKIEEKKDE